MTVLPSLSRAPHRSLRPPFALSLSEIKALQYLNPDTPLMVGQGPNEKLSTADKNILKKAGFKRVPHSVAMMIDLTEYASSEAYYSSLPKSTRRALNRYESLPEGTVESDCIRPEDFTPDLIAQIFEELVLPGSASRGIDPYNITSAEKYLSLVHDWSQPPEGEEYFLLLQKIEGVLVSFMAIKTETLAHAVSKVGGSWEQTGLKWSRHLSGDEKIATAEVSLVKPFAKHSEISSGLSDLSRWNAIKWAKDQKLSVFSMGLEPYPYFRGQYVGVASYKAKWHCKPVLIWAKNQNLYLRFTECWAFRENINCIYFCFEGSNLKLFALLPQLDAEMEAIRIVETGNFFSNHIVVRSSRDREWLLESLANSKVTVSILSDKGPNV